MSAKKKKKTVVISILGTVLDQGRSQKRWQKWRPSVSICQQEDLLVDRFEMLCDPKNTALSNVIADDIKFVSPKTKVNKNNFAPDDPWDFEEVYGALYDFAKEYPFDVENENYLLSITTGTHVAQICMFLLADAKYFPAHLLQGSPRKADGKAEPDGSVQIIDLDLDRYASISQRKGLETLSDLSFLKSGIATKNKLFNRMISEIERVAIASPEAILLLGPTGAGKTQLARRIFELKHQKRKLTGSLIEVNCATLRGDNAMSTLFGHVKGAFTGAQGARPGLLKSADNGVVFLDEVGELGLDEQAMLLRAIEQKTFLPMGSDKEVSSDFQLIVGTNRDLLGEVRKGKFREDLLARINLWTYKMPGLSERPEDIEPNLDYELDRFAQKAGANVRFNVDAKRSFLKFSRTAAWNGNFRDLNAAVTRMATLSPDGRINVATVADEICRLETSWAHDQLPGCEHIATVMSDDQIGELDRFDVVQLNEVIATCRASRSLSEAGRKLFQVSRTKRSSVNDADRLKKYLGKFGIETESLFGT